MGSGAGQDWQAGYGRGGPPSQPSPVQYPSSWWSPQNQFGGQQQAPGGQPLWQNPFSPMNAGDWAALSNKYYPAKDPIENIVYAYKRGGESEMSDAIESHYGPHPNPAIFSAIAEKMQKALTPDFMMDWESVRKAWAVTHPAYEGWVAAQEAKEQAARDAAGAGYHGGEGWGSAPGGGWTSSDPNQFGGMSVTFGQHGGGGSDAGEGVSMGDMGEAPGEGFGEAGTF